MQNLKFGVAWGMFVGVVLALFAGAVVILRGGLPESAPPVATLLAIYPLGGILGGALIGVLRPWLTTRERVFVIAPLALFPTVAAMLILSDGLPTRWDGATWFAAITTSIVLGIIGGRQLWKASQREF